MFHALDHVIVCVRDLADATRRYATLFGRRPSWRGEHPGWGSANTLFRLENTYLELLAPAGEGPIGDLLRGRLGEVGEGAFGLALATADAAAARATLAERGLEPAEVSEGVGRDADSGLFRRWRNVMLPAERTRGVFVFAIEHRSPPEMLPPAEVAGDAKAAISGIDHAVVQSPDADAAIALWGDALGLRLALDRSFPDWGMRLCFLRVGGVTVEIAQPLDGSAAVEGDRLWGLSWRVPDADAAHDRLVAAGVEVSAVRKGRKPGTRVLSVKDGTCGVPTLLLEPATSD